MILKRQGCSGFTAPRFAIGELLARAFATKVLRFFFTDTETAVEAVRQ